MCADKARAVSYRHTVNLGQLKYSLPAGRRWVETSREVPDTLPSSFRWRCPGGYRRMTRADEGVGPYRMALVGADLCVRPLPGHHHIRVGADAHIRPFPAPIHHQAKRKRI